MARGEGISTVNRPTNSETGERNVVHTYALQNNYLTVPTLPGIRKRRHYMKGFLGISV